MNARRLNAFIDDLVSEVRPRRFEADAQDREILRAAIALRAERPGDAMPDKAFIVSLHDQLADLTASTPVATGQATGWRRGRALLFGVAAAFALVGGTAAVTETSTHGTVQQSASVLNAQALRTATFETSTGQVVGQVVVSNGHPSWVFMNVDAPYTSGTMACELHLANGAVVAAGTVDLQQGKGEITKVTHLDTGELRGATLSNSSGAVQASATFA